MDEDNISFQQGSSSDAPTDDAATVKPTQDDAAENPEQVFDITDDLTISPVPSDTDISGKKNVNPTSFKNTVEQSLDAELNRATPHIEHAQTLPPLKPAPSPSTPPQPTQPPQAPIQNRTFVAPSPIQATPPAASTPAQGATAGILGVLKKNEPAPGEQAALHPKIPIGNVEQAQPTHVYSLAGKADQARGPKREPLAEMKAGFEAAHKAQGTPLVSTPPRIVQQESILPGSSKNPDDLKNIRTYEGDVANVMSRKGTSTASIAIAESAAHEGEERIGEYTEPSHATRNLIVTLVSIVLVAGGLIGAYYLYSISPLAPPAITPPTAQIAPALIPADSHITISVDNATPTSILGRITGELAKPAGPDTVKEIIPVITTNTVTSRVPMQDALKIADITPPDILVRSLGQQWMLGTYTNPAGHTEAFIVASDTFFQNAFTGMLQWESVMADDLKLFLSPPSTYGIANSTLAATSTPVFNPLDNLNAILPRLDTTSSSSPATSTPATTTPSKTKSKITLSTTTPKTSASSTATSTTMASTTANDSIVPYFTLRGRFVDRIIRNKDVREFVTDDGKVLFLYSFVDNGKLVVAASEQTLAALIIRLEKQAFVR